MPESRREAVGSGSAAFISYAREDRQYARRLSSFLIRKGIPLWYDEAIGTGSEWQPEIERRIRACAALIIIMTPAAQASSWVRRELLLAEELGKQILPLLLEGEPFWTLSHINYEHVIGGREPSQGFVMKLKHLVDETDDEGLQPRPADELGGPELEPPLIPGMDIADLSAALDQQAWLEADRWTYRALLALRPADPDPLSLQQRKDWLLRREITALPRNSLRAIDKAWSAYSAGRFGFSSQLSVWRSLSHYGPISDYRRFEVFAAAVGWRDASGWSRQYHSCSLRETPRSAIFPR